MGASNSVPSATAPKDVVTNSRFIRPTSSKHQTETAGNRAGPWVAKVIDAARREARVGVEAGLIQVRNLRIQPRVSRQDEQVIHRYVQVSAARVPRQRRQIERVVDREVLEPHERGLLHPA